MDSKNKVAEIIKQLFSKKIGRSGYALRYFPTALIAFFAMGGLSDNGISALGGAILVFAAPYALLLIVQRMNDIEMSRWYLILTLVPFVNFFFGVALLVRKGKSLPEREQQNHV